VPRRRFYVAADRIDKRGMSGGLIRANELAFKDPMSPIFSGRSRKVIV
jgi:hypothetical protein